MESKINDLRSEISNGISQPDVIVSMKQRGFAIIDAIKATRELFGLSLGAAKELVASHPAYNEVAVASMLLHNEIIQAFEDCANNSDNCK